MTVYELISAHDLTSHQRNEMLAAYDENPEGFERVARRTLTAKNPTAALIASIRKGDHAAIVDNVSIEALTLADAVDFANQLYHARIQKYPPIDEPGWTLDDAIGYGVDIAGKKYGGFAADDIERSLRIRIGKPWDENSDPALGTGCPPELLANILLKVGRIGTPAPKETGIEREPSLSERLLATLNERAA